MRLGDVSSALLVYAGAGLLGWSVSAFAIVNAGLSLVWIALALAIVLEQRGAARGSAPAAPADQATAMVR